jgi:hypothetical protein
MRAVVSDSGKTGARLIDWSKKYTFPPRKDSPAILLVVGAAILATAVTVALAAIISGPAYIKHRRQKTDLKNLQYQLQASSAQIADIDKALQLLDCRKALIEQADRLPFVQRYVIDFERLTLGEVRCSKFSSMPKDTSNCKYPRKGR